MELSPRYNAQETERKWYQHWLDKNYFRSTPDDREPFTIVIPPPNVTGVLHMGHMLNNTIQDILIRKARLEGKNACWVPGTDHASIATEAKVVKLLREKGINKGQISRQEFLKYAFEWKDKYGGIILDQLRLLGASCDWERTRFTMEEKLSRAVVKVFVDLYKKGHIYRSLRMTNWDPEAKTALSNEEVLFTEENSKFYHLNYRIEGTTDQFITIATTRPETILADAAIAVHPDDERYKHLVGKMALIPMINRAIPIIADTYVKMDFGTGALKITPAHDANDYEVGLRHNLPILDIFNPDGTLNKKAQFYVGQDRFWVRKQIAKDLDAQGCIAKIEEYLNKVGRSERTNAVIEPRLTMQWFVRMETFAKTALNAVEKGDVRFLPEHFINMYRTWLQEDNVRDWCISRQLWWGQQIPAYYHKHSDAIVVAEDEADLQTQIEALGLKREDFTQDEDVVDTWFSSWLWPLSVFDAFEKDTDLKEFKYYYPTNVLVTGWDIMFFWVARMIMAGYEWGGDLLGEELAAQKSVRPFQDVYYTGMVRDKLRRKMSKSLGNSPDAIELIHKYSADGVRFGMLSCAAVGNDIIFDAPFEKDTIINESKLCETGRNFTNKLWNALRLLKGWEITDAPADDKSQQINDLAKRWIHSGLQKTIESVNQSFEQYRLSEALMTLYNFVWGDFCSWYLEMIKPAYQQPIDRATYNFTVDIFEKCMTLLHPFMPFVTEEVWSHLREREAGDDCVVSRWLTAEAYDKNLLAQVDAMKSVVMGVREVRNQKQIPPKELLDVFGKQTADLQQFWQVAGLAACVEKMAFLQTFATTEQDIAQAVSFLAGTMQFFVAFEEKIDVEAERVKLEKELEYARGFVDILSKKLSNERFVQNAKPEVVELERKKLADNLEKIKLLENSLAQLN